MPCCVVGSGLYGMQRCLIGHHLSTVDVRSPSVRCDMQCPQLCRSFMVSRNYVDRGDFEEDFFLKHSWYIVRWRRISSQSSETADDNVLAPNKCILFSLTESWRGLGP